MDEKYRITFSYRSKHYSTNYLENENNPNPVQILLDMK